MLYYQAELRQYAVAGTANKNEYDLGFFVKYGDGGVDISPIKIATHLSVLWATRNAREEENLADVVIQVNAKGISLYDLSKSRELLRRGRKAAEDKLPEIRALR